MTTALDNLLKAAKAVARHEQAYRQCARPERWPIMMPVGELLDLSNAIAAVEAAPAAVPALGEVEREATAQAIMRAAGGDAIVCSIAYKLADAAIAALRLPHAPASGEDDEPPNIEALLAMLRARADWHDLQEVIFDDTAEEPNDPHMLFHRGAAQRIARAIAVLSPSQPGSD